MKYHLQRSQQLNCDLETAWEFFSSPYNLSKITPKEMGFVVLSDVKDKKMFKGMEINYTLTPLFGIKTKWKTEITQVDEHKSFTDEQKRGPYKSWKHRHVFIPKENGVLMKDDLIYEMPFGILGKLVHSIIVGKKLQNIFDHRYEVLEILFNTKETRK